MRAKNRFYALGQSAKAHGVNRVRAVKHFHIEAAPKWAKQAFLAGWEDAECEDEIEWRFSELSERAKDRVRSWHWDGTYNWWENVYEMAHEDAEERGINIDGDRKRYGYCISFDQYKNVSFDGTVDMCVALKDQTDPQYVLWHALMAEGYVYRRVSLRDARTRDIEMESSDSWRFDDGPLQGALCNDILQALESNGFVEQVEKDLQAYVTAFCDHVGKMLTEEEDYINSDEYIEEMCEANEYRFDEDGRFIK